MADRVTPDPGEVPLIWAHNVKPGEVVVPAARGNEQLISFVTMSTDSKALLTGDAIVLQRTTNRTQRRRLVAGLVRREISDRFGGFVTENHTLVVIPNGKVSPSISPEIVMGLLNSKPVDDGYRRVSGSVNVSAKLLRSLPLPQPKILVRSLGGGLQVSDDIVSSAYAATLELPVLDGDCEESR